MSRIRERARFSGSMTEFRASGIEHVFAAHVTEIVDQALKGLGLEQLGADPSRKVFLPVN